MSPIRDLLDRLRLAGAPGGAAAAVPADRSADAAELEPAFAALADAEAERARILAEGERDARQIRDDGRRRADDIVAAAREKTQAVRAAAAAAAAARGDADNRAALRDAERTAQEIRDRAARRLPGLAARAARDVLALAASDAGPGRGPGGCDTADGAP